MAKRKTEGEKRAEWAAKEDRVWERFAEKVAAARNLKEAAAVLGDSPPEGAPGRRFYSNLSFFLLHSACDVPNNSNERERGTYLGLLERMDQAGDLKPGARETIVAKFRAAKPGSLL